jgi:hypothetical protein
MSDAVSSAMRILSVEPLIFGAPIHCAIAAFSLLQVVGVEYRVACARQGR